MNVTLPALKQALSRVRTGVSIAASNEGRPRGRALAALLYFGRLRANGKLGAWPAGSTWPLWRDPHVSRRAAFTIAIEDLFSFPTDKLICDRQSLTVVPSSSMSRAGSKIPEAVTIDPFAEYLSSEAAKHSCYVFWPARGQTRGRVIIPIDDGRWAWNPATTPRSSSLSLVEFNPANTIEAQQGFQCYYPLQGLDRADALQALSVIRPRCEYWYGEPGRGRCRASADDPKHHENCQGAEGKTNVYWPRALLTERGRDGLWAMAPDGFEMIRTYARSADLDGLRFDLSVVAGTCEELRSGQDFSGGNVVIDIEWLGRQIDVEAWEALRA